MDNESLKENIRKIRKDSGMTQSEMAERLGMSRTAYRNIENGETRLISGNLEKIAEILGTTSGELVFGYSSGNRENNISDMEETYRKTIESTKTAHFEEISRLTAEISRLTEEITRLKQHIDTQRELIESKDEIISMLKRFDSERKNS